MTNEQKKEWFLRLDPNGKNSYHLSSQARRLYPYSPGRIPIIVDNTRSPPFPVHETSAEMLYLLKFADKNDEFGFKDEWERNECLQWLFFWHGSGPYWMIWCVLFQLRLIIRRPLSRQYQSLQQGRS